MQMIYLVFNEGVLRGPKDDARADLADEAIRLGRLVLRMFQSEPEVMGLLALMLLQRSRQPARFDDQGAAILMEDQDQRAVAEAVDPGGARADRQGDAASQERGPIWCRRRSAALRSRATEFRARADSAGIDALYVTLERLQPSPVVTLNRAVALSKTKGAGGGARDDRTAG